MPSWRQNGQGLAPFAPYLIHFRAGLSLHTGVPQTQPLERSAQVLTGMGMQTTEKLPKTMDAHATLQISALLPLHRPVGREEVSRLQPRAPETVIFDL